MEDNSTAAKPRPRRQSKKGIYVDLEISQLGRQSNRWGCRFFEHPKYHDSTNILLMVSLLYVLQRAENAMKNTIDDADYIINKIVFLLII